MDAKKANAEASVVFDLAEWKVEVNDPVGGRTVFSSFAFAAVSLVRLPLSTVGVLQNE